MAYKMLKIEVTDITDDAESRNDVLVLPSDWKGEQESEFLQHDLLSIAERILSYRRPVEARRF